MFESLTPDCLFLSYLVDSTNWSDSISDFLNLVWSVYGEKILRLIITSSIPSLARNPPLGLLLVCDFPNSLQRSTCWETSGRAPSPSTTAAPCFLCPLWEGSSISFLRGGIPLPSSCPCMLILFLRCKMFRWLSFRWLDSLMLKAPWESCWIGILFDRIHDLLYWVAFF